MNGGPGCTSLKGGFEELGQLVFNRHSFTENTTLAPKMYYNPVGWTRKSTMLYFESPPGVGFSYCDSCVGNATCDCVATDVSTAEDNYDALVSFFNGFPVRLVASRRCSLRFVVEQCRDCLLATRKVILIVAVCAAGVQGQ